MLMSGVPVILLERVDSAILWARNFGVIKTLIGVFKNRIMRKVKNNNMPTYRLRVHYRSIMDHIIIDPKTNKMGDLSDQIPNLRELKPREIAWLDKLISPVLWDFHSSILSDRMQPYHTFNKSVTKDIDVFCVCSERDPISGAARKHAKHIIRSIPSIKHCVEPLESKKYINYFCRSLICVSCWGFGEWTHMDGYAMFARTILIKPDSDYVKMIPDIYQNKHYIKCKPDYSDLPQIITNLINRYNTPEI